MSSEPTTPGSGLPPLPPPAAPMLPKPPKSPAVATFLSLFPGLGQVYNAQPAKALVFFFAWVGCIYLTAQGNEGLQQCADRDIPLHERFTEIRERKRHPPPAGTSSPRRLSGAASWFSGGESESGRLTRAPRSLARRQLAAMTLGRGAASR